MIRKIFFIILLTSVSTIAAPTITGTPYLQQKVLYYTSDRVNMGGLGVGAGIQAVYKRNFVANAEADVFWANGNAVSTKLALGYQRQDKWAPVIFGTFSLLWGQRTEILSETGERPAAPVWTAGLSGSLIRFKFSRGFASALELGYGFGPNSGSYYEVTILTAGVNW